MAHGTARRGASQDRWLVSYADFITLLFAFFAMMYAISSVDAKKLTKVAHALQVAFDDSARGRSIASGEGLLSQRGSRLVETFESAHEIRTMVTRELAPEIASHRLEVRADRRGLVLSLPEAGLFALGSDELSAPAQSLIERVAAALSRVRNPIRVEGHTDDLPIHTMRFRSNWDLSTARATRVIEFLIERGSLEPQRLSSAGYAEYHPQVPNDSPDSRARNRRVDLVLLNATTKLAEEPDSEIVLP